MTKEEFNIKMALCVLRSRQAAALLTEARMDVPWMTPELVALSDKAVGAASELRGALEAHIHPHIAEMGQGEKA